jgi:hypothetical protein
MRRAKDPSHVLGIQARAFAIVDEIATALDLEGRRIVVSVDDTKLVPSVRTHTDRESGAVFVIGGVGKSILVSDPDELEHAISNVKNNLATKVLICNPSILLYDSLLTTD